MDGIVGALGGLGLASSAGLNAYIPALLTAILARFTDLVELPEEFRFLSSGWVLATLTVLLLVEEVVDKIPGADHANDVVQTVVRPVSGAVLFAAGSKEAFGRHTWLALLVGLVAALTVHGVKSAGRGVVNVSTAGLGAPVVSVVEDVLSLIGTIVAIVAPVLVVLMLGLFVWFAVTVARRRRARRQARTLAA